MSNSAVDSTSAMTELAQLSDADLCLTVIAAWSQAGSIAPLCSPGKRAEHPD